MGRPAETKTAIIDDARVLVRSGETLLDAALRSGIDFPNACRVGGCGSCKCRLVAGKVTERTDTGYLLTREEIDAGSILACQSVPQTDVRIVSGRAPRRVVTGRVVAKEKLTGDIVRLVVALDAPLDYRAGQFAELSLAAHPDLVRAYSFASPPRASGEVDFFVRKVEGGALSTLLHDGDVVGQVVSVRGPTGDFWLRGDRAPLVMIAGGSGLGPILAMLEADAEGTRPCTLLFGARTPDDLYALDRIAALAARRTGSFRFVPVVEDAPDGAWTGARGVVTSAIPDDVGSGAHAYVCGPPAMVDAALARLLARGVAREDVRFDRFTTHGDLAPAAAAEPAPADATLLDYLKYFAFHGIGLFALAMLLVQGAAIPLGLLFVVAVYILGDAFLGDDVRTPRFRHPWLLTAELWLALPLVTAIVFASVWGVSTGDPLGFGRWIGAWAGYDVLAGRAATTTGQHVAAWVMTGLMIGMVGTVPAHELTHRTWDPISMFVGRLLLAFSFDTSFAIEHVYGHHRYVATREDPATAPRGRNVYHHIVASTAAGNVSAWRIERARLEKRGHAVFGLRNAFLRGHAVSVALAAAAWAMGGLTALAYFLACAAWGKALLEIVNYTEHYGLVRSPSAPVAPRHSWNTNRRVSSWAMFNLTRHSHHHAAGELPYHALRPYAGAPTMLSGYLTTIVIALVPPLWERLMAPRVLAWDRDFATPEERRLAAEANARCGPGAFDGASAGAGVR